MLRIEGVRMKSEKKGIFTLIIIDISIRLGETVENTPPIIRTDVIKRSRKILSNILNIFQFGNIAYQFAFSLTVVDWKHNRKCKMAKQNSIFRLMYMYRMVKCQ